MFNQPDVGVAGLFDLGLVIPGRRHDSDQTTRFLKGTWIRLSTGPMNKTPILKKEKKNLATPKSQELFISTIYFHLES